MVWFCGPWILRFSDGLYLSLDITSSPSGVEPHSTKQLELQTAWDNKLNAPSMSVICHPHPWMSFMDKVSPSMDDIHR